MGAGSLWRSLHAAGNAHRQVRRCAGRVKTYEAIVKGEPIEEPGIPASFRVLVKELQSLGLAVEAITDTGEVIRFGKDEEKSRQPNLPTGLFGVGNHEE